MSDIKDKALYETIVFHRYKYARVGDVDYNLHNPNTLNPIPIDTVIKEWEDDYLKMKEDMIYEDFKPTFKDLIINLEKIREKLQILDWEFELKFPVKNA